MKTPSKIFILSGALYMTLVTSTLAGGGPCGGQGSSGGGQGCTVVSQEEIVTSDRVVTRYVLRTDAGKLITQYYDNEDRITRLSNKEIRKLNGADRITARRDRIDARLNSRADKKRNEAKSFADEAELLRRQNSVIAQNLGGSRVARTERVSSSSEGSVRVSRERNDRYDDRYLGREYVTRESRHESEVSGRPEEYRTSASTCGDDYYGPYDGICILKAKFSTTPCEEQKVGGHGETKITCKEGEILNPKTNACEKIAKEEVLVQEEEDVRHEESGHEEVACDPKTHKVDPDTGDCVKIPEVTKPVVKKKLVRTKKPTPSPVKKPVAKKPVEKKPVAKKPEEKKVAAKEPCEDDLKLAREESARLKREKEEADRLAAESVKKTEEANRLLEIERQKKLAASEGNFHVLLKGKAKTGGEMIETVGGGRRKPKGKVRYSIEGNGSADEVLRITNDSNPIVNGYVQKYLSTSASDSAKTVRNEQTGANGN